jgi:hypothetical protein
MAKLNNICEEGYLNEFVKPVSEGGWGLCETIVSWMTVKRGYSAQEFYDLIQASGLDPSIKALDIEQIKKILNYMDGKTFSGKTIGIPENQSITYEPA